MNIRSLTVNIDALQETPQNFNVMNLLNVIVIKRADVKTSDLAEKQSQNRSISCNFDHH